jgi:hypothetical protein
MWRRRRGRAEIRERRAGETPHQVPSLALRNDERFREFVKSLEQDYGIVRAVRIQNHVNGGVSILLKDRTVWRIAEADWRELMRHWELAPWQDHPEMNAVLFKRAAPSEDRIETANRRW